jgi:RNA polymerase sigma factor (sigma-70 family)
MNNQPCTSCGGPLRPGARFCAQCGAPQAAAPAAQSDAELAQRLGQGDEAAFAALYGRYARPVHDFVARIVREPATAEDVTQATFVQVWEQRDALRSPEAVKRWIYQIAHHFALKQVTRGPATVAMEEELQLASVEAGPEEKAVSADAARLVWDAAASLEPHQLAILDLSVRCGLASSEIAEILEVDTARASLQVNRAKEALGNAVRYLLVARRRSHCERLAELVRAGVGQLTPEQRATVDHHMRRCPACQGMALRLTAPEELFGALLLLPLPGKLTAPPHAVLTAAHVSAASPVGLRAASRSVSTASRANALHASVALVAAAAVVGGVAFGVSRLGPSPGAGLAQQPAGTTSPSVTAAGTPSGLSLPGAWSSGQRVDTNSGPPSSGANLIAVSCPSPTQCWALDTAGYAFSLADGQWNGGTPVGGSFGDNSLSCPTVGFCLAADDTGNVYTYMGDGWSAPSQVDIGPGPEEASVSCTSPTFCMAVYGDGAAYEYSDGTWSLPTELTNPYNDALLSVACPSADFCVATDIEENAYLYQSGVWYGSTKVGGYINALSCPTRSFCLAAGDDGSVYTLSNGEWSAGVPLGEGSLESVSCPTTQWCVAVDPTSAIGEQSGTWSSGVQMAPLPDGLGPLAVSCPTAFYCLAVGFEGYVYSYNSAAGKD